eukprot:tig00020710_g13264.t1
MAGGYPDRALALARRALYAVGLLDEARGGGSRTRGAAARGDPEDPEGVELLAPESAGGGGGEVELETGEGGGGGGAKEFEEKDEEKEKRARLGAARSLRILLGFVWPRGERGVRLLSAGLVLNTLLHQTVAIARPLLYKVLMDQLQRGEFRPGFVFLYGMWFWIIHITGQAKWLNYNKLQQGITRSINERTVAQLQSLPLAYHIENAAAKSISAMDRGTAGVLALLDVASNVVAPAAFDVVSLLSIFLVGYPPVYAGVLVVTAFLYALWTWVLSKRAEKLRKALGEKQSRPGELLGDALANCEAES